jgi:hypothetical protein
MSSKRVLILLSLLVLNLAILAAGELNRQAGDRELASLAGSARQMMEATSCPEEHQAVLSAAHAVCEACLCL